MYPKEEKKPLYFLPRKTKYVFDAIYNPPKTSTMKLAKRDVKTRNGIYMLVMQAAAAQTIWNNTQFEWSVFDSIARRVLAQMAAKRLREKYKGKDIGIFSLCECVGKLTLAKEPLGKMDSQIDYALSISRMFPHFNKRKGKGKEEMTINADGIKSNVSDLFGDHRLSVMSVEGLSQIRMVLDLIEFDQLKHIQLIALYHCYQGCIGGYYLWNNPFEGRFRIESMVSQCDAPAVALKHNEYFKKRRVNEQKQTFKERMAWFHKVNAILETLPQYDCGSCGFANCRSLAMRIASGEVDDSLCRVKKKVK